jgi:hypothetical protein
MPWKECSVMNEKLQFVARRLAGEAMAGGLASPVKLVTTFIVIRIADFRG